MEEKDETAVFDALFGKRMKEYRDEAGLNQQEIADKLGVKRTAYAHYESGKRQPSFEFLTEFSKLSGWTTSYLLGLSEYKTLTQEINAARLINVQNSEAASAAKKIYDTIGNLLARIDRGEVDFYDNYLEPIARISDLVNKAQRSIKRFTINEEGDKVRDVFIDFFDYFIPAYNACTDLLNRGFQKGLM